MGSIVFNRRGQQTLIVIGRSDIEWVALLKAIAFFTPKRRRCKPTRIHCAYCVYSHRTTQPIIHRHIAQSTPYDYCAQVIRTRTTNPHADSVRGRRVVRCGYTLYSGGLFSE